MKPSRLLFPLALAAAGGSWWLSRRGGKISRQLSAVHEIWPWRGHKINVATAGKGRPLVLLHALYPGASNYQWEHNFNRLARKFRVYAPDLLGFGASARPNISYDASLYAEMIGDFLREVVEEPCVVLASGQSAPFVIEAAADQPALIEKIILDTPTGLTRFADPPRMNQTLWHLFMSLPVVGTLAYFSMVTPRAIKTLVRREAVADPLLATGGLLNNIYRQAHQPGAKWAPIAMLGGRLNHNCGESYRLLKQPILILWGEVPSYIPIEDKVAFTDLNHNSSLKTFREAKLMPEFEEPAEFNMIVADWIDTGKIAA